jgi:hypothetical protein
MPFARLWKNYADVPGAAEHEQAYDRIAARHRAAIDTIVGAMGVFADIFKLLHFLPQ